MTDIYHSLLNEHHLAAIVTSADDAIISKTLDGIIRSWNPAAARMFGYQPAEIIGQPVLRLFPKDRYSEEDEILRQLRAGQRIDHYETLRQRKDGSLIEVSLTISPMRDATGTIVGASKIIRDITERKRIEQVSAHLAAIVTSADDAIISKTLDGVIRSWNPAAEQMFGYRPAEIIGQSVLRLIPMDRHNEEDEILKRLRAGLRIDHYETMRQKKDGSLIEVSLTISPMRDATGTIIGASKIIRDITERKHIENRLTESEKRLREAAEGLEQQVVIRTAELSQSHQQLRALTAQINLTEQKERQRLAGELHDYLGQILALGRIKLGLAKKHSMDASLAGLLDEVQTSINKAIAYTRSLVSQLSPPVLKEFGLAMALSWLAEQMLERDLRVRLEFRTQIPPLMEDKALLLFQSIRELLLNCIKHAQVTEAMLVVDQQDGQLHITISDCGIGFDPSGIFPVMQPTTSSPRYGLFSIRERMLSLGGCLEFQSTIGKGTTATLVFPVITSAAEVPVSLERVNSRKDESKPAKDVTIPAHTADALRLLIVDDHAMVREGLCNLLSAYQDIQIVGEARNGKEALEFASRLRPDVILMDVTMPDIDGIEATRRIKADSPHILIVGMSVHSAEQVERAMKEAGAADFINKEAAVEDLYQTILAAWNSRVKVESSPQDPPV